MMLPRPWRHPALKEQPRGAELLVVVYLNVKLSDPEGDWRGVEIAAVINTSGLDNMSENFLLHRRPWCRGARMWIMVRAGREVRSRTDYILWKDRCLFYNVSVREPRHKLDHYLVLGCLRGAPLTEQSKYLGSCKRPPL